MRAISCCVALLLLVCAEAGEGGNWIAVKAREGSNAACSHGGKFTYFVSPGTVNKIVFEFAGGGCCFSAATCASPLYTPTIDVKASLKTLENRKGLGSATDDRNPVKGWTRVFVPYCTGDAHLGNHTPAYRIRHHGRANAFEALHWAFQNVTDPEAVFVTGISAGAVASYVLAPWIFGHYRGARHYHLADSYAPVFGKKGYNDGLKNWQMAEAYDKADVPVLAPGSLEAWAPLVAAANTNWTAVAFPNATFASYVSADDSVEESFYRVEGGGEEGKDWKKAARAALDAISAPNFARFVAAGSQHGVVGGESLYTKTSQVAGGGAKVALGDWLRDMLEGKKIPMNVDCYQQGC